MAGEAVSGRYGAAARHAVADEDGMRRPGPDDRSLVDRLLEGGGDEHAFDWGWGDPAAGGLVSDREPLHDIPELWASGERSPRGHAEADGAEEKPFPTPRLHGESSRDDGRDLGIEALGRDALGDDRGRDEWGTPSVDDRLPDLELGVHDRRFDGPALDGDPLDALSTARVHAENGPFGDRSPDREVPDRGPTHDVPMDGDHVDGRSGTDPLDRSPLAPPLPERDPFDGERSEQAHHALLDRDPPSPEPPERKLTDPRLRRWADRNRPSGPPRLEHPTPPPFVDEPAAADELVTERGSDDRGSDDLFGSEPARDADPFADAVATESALTGRIRITEVEAPGPDRAPREPVAPDRSGSASGPDPLDVMPDPTTAFTVVAPAAPARPAPPEAPAVPLEEYAARRRAAEQAATSAEEAAASAAERASAAIAAAARAAEEAEAAAEAAAKAAEKATEAAEAEVRAIADSVARGDAPGRQDAPADAPEPPTQAVPLIAPARAPGRRLPPRRPAGPPLRANRIDEPGRPPRAAHQNGPGRGPADGEATAVLTGLDALRDPVRPRRQEPAPVEATPTVARRRAAAEPTRETDDADDPDDADHDDDPADRGVVGRLTSRPVLAALGVGAVLVLAAIVAIFTASEPDAAPAAEPAPAAVSAPVAQQSQPTQAAVNPHSQKAVAFLTALRDADIPTSSSGQAEVEAADAICNQLDQGADEAQLARSVPAVLPNVTRGQASDVVDYAQRFYC